MTFQHLAVTHRHLPHVTVVAGIDMAGRFWTTTSGHAAKVGALRRDPRAAVLDQDDDGGWSLVAGDATVQDVRRPLAALGDPLAGALGGVALARIGLANREQLVGYLRTRAASLTAGRRPPAVLVVVQAEHRLTWRAGRVEVATGRFGEPGAMVAPARHRRRRSQPQPLGADLPSPLGALVRRGGTCTVGLSTPCGPVAVPGDWDPETGTVDVDHDVLAHLGAELPGRCCVTLDDSHVDRPTAKLGVMLRGRAAVHRLVESPLGRAVRLAIDIERTTSWDGFATSTQAA